MFLYNSIHSRSILVDDISGESSFKPPVAYPRFDLKRPVFIRWSHRGNFSPFQSLADPVETQRSGLGVLETEIWALSPLRSIRTSPDPELFVLGPRMAGILGVGLVITRLLDAAVNGTQCVGGSCSDLNADGSSQG